MNVQSSGSSQELHRPSAGQVLSQERYAGSLWQRAAASVKSAFETLKNVLFYPLDRILRVPVYRMALDDRCSNFVKAIFFFFAKCCGRFKEFDQKMADASLQRLKDLGAKVEFLDMKEQGGGTIQAMRFTATALEERIRSFGGVWKRDGNQWVIEGPEREDGLFSQWLEFAKKLTSFRWEVQAFDESTSSWSWRVNPTAKGKVDLDRLLKEAPGKKFRFVTCSNGDCVQKKIPQEILFNHTTSSSMVGYWRLFGYILGARQNITAYDGGNTYQNSGRPISEQDFYNETDRVYQWLVKESGTDEENIWSWGNCGAGPNAAYLKLQHSKINLVLAQTFARLTDFRAAANCPSWLQKRLIRAVGGAYDWSIAKMADVALKRGERATGVSIHVTVEGDGEVSKEASEKVDTELRKLCNERNRIHFFSRSGGEPHDDDFYNDPIAAKDFLTILCS